MALWKMMASIDTIELRMNMITNAIENGDPLYREVLWQERNFLASEVEVMYRLYNSLRGPI